MDGQGGSELAEGVRERESQRIRDRGVGSSATGTNKPVLLYATLHQGKLRETERQYCDVVAVFRGRRAREL